MREVRGRLKVQQVDGRAEQKDADGVHEDTNAHAVVESQSSSRMVVARVMGARPRDVCVCAPRWRLHRRRLRGAARLRLTVCGFFIFFGRREDLPNLE